jgi:diguanylate cyclase (GGDEF)-like protein
MPEQWGSADALTGLYTRRVGERYLHQQLENSRVLTVVMINLRALKQVNERWGHACGDRVLQRVSQILNEYAATFAMICRWDGGRFLMISSSEQEPEQVFSALQARLSCLHVDAEDRAAKIPIHVLTGLARSKAGDNVGALMARVEADIERQKRALLKVA